MLKLAALGALGYAGYKYYQKNGNPFDKQSSIGNSYSGVSGQPASTSSAATSPTTDNASFSSSPTLKTV